MFVFIIIIDLFVHSISLISFFSNPFKCFLLISFMSFLSNSLVLLAFFFFSLLKEFECNIQHVFKECDLFFFIFNFLFFCQSLLWACEPVLFFSFFHLRFSFLFCFILFSFFRNVLLLHIAHLFITNIKKRTKVQRFGFIVLCFERWIPFVTCLKIVENRHNKIHRISTFMNEGLKCKCKILRKIKSTHTKHQAERARCQSQLKTDKCFNEKLKDHRTKVLEIMQMERLILIYANESSTYSVFVSLFLLLLFLHSHGF